MTKTNQAMNNFIRIKASRNQLPTNATETTTPPKQPSGNAGNGTGSPPAPSKMDMNAFLRFAAGK